MIILQTVVFPEAVPPATPELADRINQSNFETLKMNQKGVPITKGCLRGAGAEGEI